ncbi:MAG: Uma2 family endonuclease [Planctomycetes bacterium]|nr:Uma2 family endonuclease [Planctomycetota bacterium]
MPDILERPQTSAERESDALYEIVYGEYRELEPMGALQVVLAFALGTRLDSFARSHKRGVAVTEMLFILDAARDLRRRPDVAFVSYDRWPQPTIPETEAWDVVPGLAVEIISPTNKSREMHTKVREYFAAGVRLVWVFYPDSGDVYTSHRACTILSRNETLDGGDVLPGFQVRIEELYEAATRPE